MVKRIRMVASDRRTRRLETKVERHVNNSWFSPYWKSKLLPAEKLHRVARREQGELDRATEPLYS
jgi:hypothetical protein